MLAEKVHKYRTTNLPRQSGEVGRLRVLKGAEVGAVFVIKASSVTLGRGNEVDLVISDLKASRAHARLDFTRDGWVVSDLGSANGIFFQGEYIRKFGLKSHDYFTVGETIFEFLTSQEDTRILTAPAPDSKEIERMDYALAQQKIRVKSMAKPVKAAAPAAGARKTNPLLVVAVIGMAVYYFYDQQQTENASKATHASKTVKKSEKIDERTLASYLPSGVTKDVEKTADQYYSTGFREYIKGNYLRAKDSFALALQVNPAHEKARHYMAIAEKENTDEINRLVSAARDAKLVGRISAARGSCETAIRHLQGDQANPAFEDCKAMLKELKGEGEQ